MAKAFYSVFSVFISMVEKYLLNTMFQMRVSNLFVILICYIRKFLELKSHNKKEIKRKTRCTLKSGEQNTVYVLVQMVFTDFEAILRGIWVKIFGW